LVISNQRTDTNANRRNVHGFVDFL
jgi:hypothetical protein